MKIIFLLIATFALGFIVGKYYPKVVKLMHDREVERLIKEHEAKKTLKIVLKNPFEPVEMNDLIKFYDSVSGKTYYANPKDLIDMIEEAKKHEIV